MNPDPHNAHKISEIIAFPETALEKISVFRTAQQSKGDLLAGRPKPNPMLPE